MSDDLATTLLIKPESRVLLLNAPIGYGKKLQPLPAGVTITDRRSQADADVSLVFVRDVPELKRFQSGFAALEADAVLWVCFPKGGPLNHELLRAALAKDELTGDAPIAFDETWQCIRFRAPEDDDSESDE